MNDNLIRQQIKAFVGRSFHEKDEKVWLEIREILEALRRIGFLWEDAKPSQLIPISEKIRKGIAANDLYLGILTRRRPVDLIDSDKGFLPRIVRALHPDPPAVWSVSPWIVQESGYAMALGKKVLFLIEEGVDFPTSDMHADSEWISFNRKNVKKCQTPLTSMLVSEIGKMISLAPVSAQPERVQEDPKPETEAQQAEQAPDFLQVREQLNARHFDEADRLFALYLTTAPAIIRDWLRYYYLRRKAVAGDSDSLTQLETLVTNKPKDLEARLELADYYNEFKQHDVAIRILREGEDIVPPTLKTQLLLKIADTYANSEQYDLAGETIATLLSKANPTQSEIKGAFEALAGIAKKHNDAVLESASLERALEIEPANSTNRFRLAYLYQEMKKYGMSVYHYRLRLEQDGSSLVMNNLAVAFGNLDVKGKEIELYEAAAPTNPLAKSNLSQSYIAAGFLQHAEHLAREALRESGEEHLRGASGALARVAEQRSEENKREEQIISNGKIEAAFRSRFAEGFLSRPVDITGLYKTKHGLISFEQTNGGIIGTSKSTLPPSPFSNIFGSLGAPKPRVRLLRFEASMKGRSGRFSLQTREAEEALINMANPAVIGGLVILGEDGKFFDVLEEGEASATIYRATKVESGQVEFKQSGG